VDESIEASAGDGEIPWEVLLAAFRRSFDAECARYRLGAEEREDLRSDVLLRVAERFRDRYRELPAAASLRTWVARQVRWGIVDHWRAFYRRERSLGRPSSLGETELEDPGTAADVAGFEREEVAAAVRDCLARLTEVQRDRVLGAERCRAAGTPQAQFARSLGIALDSLKETLQRARALLRRCLESKGFGLDPPFPGRATE
jgi:RNA polymerase sigma factor (sigma-70 family)